MLFSIGNAQDVFNKVYNYQNDYYDAGISVIQTLDEGYLISGNVNTLSGFLGLYIIKTDAAGDTLWTKVFNFSQQGTDNGYSVIQLVDSTYLICGSFYDSTEGSKDTYLLKLSSVGDLIWHKIVEGGINDVGLEVKQAQDGGFFIAGFSYDDTTFNTSKAYLIKTDSLGNKLWQKNYGATGYNFANSIDFTGDGGFILGGETNTMGAGQFDLCLYKTDGQGNLEWQKAYGGTGNDIEGYVINSYDGGYVLVGRKEISNPTVEGYIIKTDDTGKVEWERSFARGGNYEGFKKVRQLPDSSYIVGGFTIDYNTASLRPRIWLAKIEPNNGDTLWTRVYTHYGGDTTHDYIFDINLTYDGGFIFTGYVINNFLPAKNDVFLVKTDCHGCDGTNCTPDPGCPPLPIDTPEPPIIIYEAGIYPNPFNTSATIVITHPDLTLASDLSIRLYDVLGRVEKEIFITPYKNGSYFELPLLRGNLSPGLYFYQIRMQSNITWLDSKIIAIGKFMVQ
ncbi:MAG: T9SS type A sorting domain-containing protein [Bacteroidetes bacterium]|nr:T9SS type A sorting domain-containing protein [Bacteroidota bacterium]